MTDQGILSSPTFLGERVRLHDIPLFRQLPDEVSGHVLRHAITQEFLAEHVVFRQGDIPSHLHIILDGEVGLTGLDAGGEHTVLEILPPGATFTAAAVVTAQPYLMGAKCLRHTTLLMIPAAQLREDMGRFPDLALALVSSLSAHFRAMVAEVKDLKLKSASQRLGLYLLSLTEVRQGPAMVVLPHSKTVISARIGIRRETYSRAFNSLAEMGVTGKGVRVLIEDVARLEQYCAE